MANFGLPEGRTWNLFGLPDWLKRQFPEGWHKQPFGNQVPTMLPGLTLPRDRLGAMGEEINLFGITPEKYWEREKDKMGPQYRGIGGQSGFASVPYTMESMKEGIATKLAAADTKKSEMSELKKLSNMMMLSSIAEAMQADKFPPPAPRSVGTTKQPVSPTLMSTGPQRRQKDDLLNFLYGGASYGRRA